MQLNFYGAAPISHEQLRTIFAAMASHLLQRQVSLQERSREELPDPNYGKACFRARWEDHDASYTEEVSGGDGNPRDGYAYNSQHKLVLQRPSGEVTLSTTDTSADFRLQRLLISCAGITGEEFFSLRALLQKSLGVESDHSASPYYARYNAQQLDKAGERARALSLAREGLASSPHAAVGRAELLEWVSTIDPQENDLQQRLREAPVSVTAWREALRAPPAGFTEAQIRQNLLRLCPFALEFSEGPMALPWFSHPYWPLLVPKETSTREAAWQGIHLPAGYIWGSFVSELSLSLTGLRLYSDWQEVSGETLEAVNGWRCIVSRAAAYVGGTLRAYVTLRALRDQESCAWTWLSGPESGDFLLVVRLERGPRSEDGALFWLRIGTQGFLSEVEAAIHKATPFRIYPVSEEESLQARALWVLPWWSDSLDGVALAAATLQAAQLPEERLARALELLQCRCPQPSIGYCPHRKELLHLSREEERQGGAQGRARALALEAALYATGEKPNNESMRRQAKAAHDRLVVVSELRGEREGK